MNEKKLDEYIVSVSASLQVFFVCPFVKFVQLTIPNFLACMYISSITIIVINAAAAVASTQKDKDNSLPVLMVSLVLEVYYMVLMLDNETKSPVDYNNVKPYP